MQDHRKFAGDCNACSRHSAALCNGHAPSPEVGPFLRTHEQRMGRFVKRGSFDLVTTSADLALDIGLAGLIAGWRQTEMGTDIARSTKAIGGGRWWHGTPAL